MNVVQQEDETYNVMDGDRVVASGLTNRKAWWMHDRLTGEATSKVESTSDWAFKQSTDRAK